MQRSAPLSFWLLLGVTTTLACLYARRLCPGVGDQSRPEVFGFRDKFLGSYGPVSLDPYILGHDILGASQQVRGKDVLLLGSSKMMFGVDAGLAEHLLASQGLKAGFYNLGFGHGEGLVFPAWLLQRLGIRDRLALIDATDNTSQYHVEAVSQAAMNSSPLDAWKVIIEANLQFRFDRLLHGLVPRGRIDTSGVKLEPAYLRPFHWRDWTSGDVVASPGPNRYPTSPGVFAFEFDEDRRLREKVFPAFRNLNLDYGFISIPYSGNDPKWVEQAAKYAGCWYLPIESAGLYTVDQVHFNKQSREIFTRGLVDALTREPFGLADRFSRIRSGHILRSPPVSAEGSPTPLLQQVAGSFNIVLFKGRYYCVPHGLAVDWQKDEVERLPGVAVRGSLGEAVEFARTNRPAPSRTPVLQATVKSFNIVLFQGRYYVVPHGLAVDWEKAEVEKLPGVVVRGSLEEAEEFAKKR
jgi:hypothetical protein